MAQPAAHLSPQSVLLGDKSAELTAEGRSRSRSPRPKKKKNQGQKAKSQGGVSTVKDNDIFLLPSRDYEIMFALTAIAVAVRLYKIWQPTSVVFDEVQ